MTREEAIDTLETIISWEEFGFYEEEKEALEMALEALKEPEPIRGTWIDARDYCGEFLCSFCHETNINNFYKYCPNCGAEMEEE